MSVRPPSPTLIVISPAAGGREPYGEFARFIFVRSARMNHRKNESAAVKTEDRGRCYFETGPRAISQTANAPRAKRREGVEERMFTKGWGRAERFFRSYLLRTRKRRVAYAETAD